jgi:hypothetical protein
VKVWKKTKNQEVEHSVVTMNPSPCSPTKKASNPRTSCWDKERDLLEKLANQRRWRLLSRLMNLEVGKGEVETVSSSMI